MKKIDFGMPTLLELETFTDCVSLAKKLCLDFIEINMNMPLYQPELINASLLAQALDEGLYITFHLDENFNPADFNRNVAGAYMETLAAVMELAERFDAPVINMHMAEGIHFKLPDKRVYLFEKYSGHYLSRLCEFRDLCSRALAGSGIRICIENTNGYLPFMERGIELLLENEVFGLTLDIGHNHSAGYRDKDFIRKHADRLRHMHIHDAVDSACHLVLGTGHIRLQEQLSLAEERNCRCVIETKSVRGLTESASYLGLTG